MSRPPGTRIDRYVVLEHLADGAQAEVHVAEDLDTGRLVILKFPHRHTLEQTPLVQRWRREVAITEGLDHPNLQCRLDVGAFHREPYLVLEYAAGATLRQHLSAAPGGLRLDQVTAWAWQMADGLAYLHDRGILHRDLKPENVYVTAEGTIKIGDFGAATREVRHRRHFWELPTPPEGTPEYLSPEQILGQPGDPRSDLYSWGVVVYELLTGTVPLTGPDPEAAMTAALSGHPEPPSRRRRDLPPGLDAVVLTALRRWPEHRYGSAREVIEDLDRVGPDGRGPIDLARFDLAAEPARPGAIGGNELGALVRLVGVILVAFVSVVALILALSAAVRAG